MQRGFTLVEILVVMAVTALIAGTVLPNLQKLSERVSLATDRAALIAQIEQIGYRSFATGSEFALSSGNVDKPLGDDQPAISVPAGWRVDVPRTIRYSISGFCSGGTVVVTAPDATVETFVLEAPRCRIGG